MPIEIDRFGQNLLAAKKSLDDGDPARAAELCASIQDTHPLWLRAVQMLILALRKQGKFAETLDHCRSWQEREPDNGKPWLMQGLAHEKLGDMAKAITCLEQAVKLSPSSLNAITILTQFLWQEQRVDECLQILESAVRTFPDNPLVLGRLARVQMHLTRFREAEENYERALSFAPNDSPLLKDIGKLYLKCHAYEKAVQSFNRAIDLNPSVEAYCGLALALRNQARHAEIDEVCTKALALDPNSEAAASIWVYSLNHRADLTPSQAAKIHMDQGNQLADRYRALRQPYPQAKDANRRPLNLGIISSTFGSHVTSYFMFPWLETLDRERFRLHLFADVDRRSDATDRYQRLADVWHEVDALDEKTTAELIRAEGIDILVDIQGPMETRDFMNLLAIKPAPVQISWLGYPATCGLPTVDYRFADAVTDPAGHDAYFSEQLIRLDPCFLCYEPPAGAGDVQPAPCLTSGNVTFGVLNSTTKITDVSCRLWAQVQQAVPDCRLLIKGRGFVDEPTKQRYIDMFQLAGIDMDRLELVPFQLAGENHYGVYDKVDIALDSFPYNGTTTTCETLWKGVPVVTLMGDRHVQRVSGSILSCVGLSSLVATKPEDYVTIAAELAGNPEGLNEMHMGMRERLKQSPLFDHIAYTRQMERAFEQMWQQYCET